ncbi:MAG TPA: polyprenyl synthetase family protein [Thermoleophilaceae bacterium]|nr:polyprenyl synthetase family protein [Thermoleophilaceae bacterium]
MNGARAQLAPVLAAGGPAITRLLERTEERLAEVAESHGETLARYAAGTLAAGGKRLRPLLVFLCAGGDGGRLVTAATSVELLHMATLVHDDVLDRAMLRRGSPTVFAEGGRPAATAAGDFLFSRAFAELATTGSEDGVRALSAASSALARGELMQRADAWSEAVTPERYLERCRLKTASLFEASCRLGSLLGGPPEMAGGLGRFGERVGLAFQMLDDVLDVSGPTERTGKPRGADLLDGTVTLPLILAREADPELRALDLRSAVTGAAQAAELCQRIELTGVLEEARRQALTHVAEAKELLGGMDLPEERSHALRLVADGVVERYA